MDRAKRGPKKIDWSADTREIDRVIREMSIEDAESRKRVEDALSVED